MTRALIGLVYLGMFMLVGGGILMALGANVTNTVASTLTAGSTARMAADNATAGIGQFAAQLPLIGIVIGISAVILILFGVLFPTFGAGGRGRE